MKIDSNTETYNLYYQLTICPEAGFKIIGKGEASALALAKQHNGIVAIYDWQNIKTGLKF